MSKAGKRIFMLIGAGVLAVLVCLCVLGSTMARYASAGEGDGTFTVALWDLETSNTFSASIAAESISPSCLAYDDVSLGYTDSYGDAALYPRTNGSGWIHAFRMENRSDVAAEVTLERAPAGEITARYESYEHVYVLDVGIKWAEGFEWGIGWATEEDVVCDDSTGEPLLGDDGYTTTPISERALANKYGAELMHHFDEAYWGDYALNGEDLFWYTVNSYDVFSVLLSDSGDAEGGESFTLRLNAYGDGAEGSGYEADIYAEVVWSSICEESFVSGVTPSCTGLAFYDNTGMSDWAAFSDAVDTILCMYCDSIEIGITWTAVQASTLP